MRATWRPLPAWPYPQRAQQPDLFRTSRSALSWDRVLQELEWELERHGADDVLIGAVVEPRHIGISGILKAEGRGRERHPGAEVSFDAHGRRLVFHTDAYDSLQSNLRAITLGLAALRAVDRYGITSSSEQYAGFAQLTAGGPDIERGRKLVERAGGLKPALMAHHPDHGGEARDFADVQAYREQAGL